jgi:hypothetical protein
METISAVSRATAGNYRATLEIIQQYQRFGLIMTKIARI